MIVYNVTVNIENDVREEWLKWMQEEHIPKVMKTGYFLENKMFKVLVDEEQGTTYSIQYTCKDKTELEEYQRLHAPSLQQEHALKFANKFVAFRTLLEHIG